MAWCIWPLPMSGGITIPYMDSYEPAANSLPMAHIGGLKYAYVQPYLGWWFPMTSTFFRVETIKQENIVNHAEEQIDDLSNLPRWMIMYETNQHVRIVGCIYMSNPFETFQTIPNTCHFSREHDDKTLVGMGFSHNSEVPNLYIFIAGGYMLESCEICSIHISNHPRYSWYIFIHVRGDLFQILQC